MTLILFVFFFPKSAPILRRKHLLEEGFSKIRDIACCCFLQILQFFVNGTQVSFGPAGSDLNHWNFETLDIAQYLKAGNNILGSLVLNEGEFKPIAQMSSRTAFILQGDGDLEKIVNTGPTWKARKDNCYGFFKASVIGFFCAFQNEMVDFNKTVENWNGSDFDDSSWTKVKLLGNGFPKGVDSREANKWMLVPRTIPAMEQKIQHFQSLRKQNGVTIPKEFPLQKKDITVPANTTASFLLDQKELTNAFTSLQFSQGKNATIVLTYAESLYDEKTMEKANRNDVEGKKILGVKDSLISNGNKNQLFMGLNWRTFRYVEVAV